MKQRTKISRYVNNNTFIYSKLLNSNFPIEYQFLLQEYLLKLMPFYVVSKYAEVPNDVIVTILKIIYRQYFSWYQECNLKSHKFGIEYLKQKQIEQNPSIKIPQNIWFNPEHVKPTRNNFSFELKEDMWELLHCECCLLQQKCKYDGCETLILLETSNYCKKHMRCAKCHFNIRLQKCNCGENTTYMNLGIQTLGVDNHLQTPSMISITYGEDNKLIMPKTNTPKRYYLQTKEDLTKLSNIKTEQISESAKLLLLPPPPGEHIIDGNYEFSDDDIIDDQWEWALEP